MARESESPKRQDSTPSNAAEPRYVRFDGMTWPNPDAAGELDWKLRYGKLTREDELFAASVASAYIQLVEDSQRVRNAKVTGLRAATVEARNG